MSLLIARHIEKSWGARTILRDASLRLEWRQRIGLVGPNGSGKTTFLRILAGTLEPDRGRVQIARGIRVAMLEQIQTVARGVTVWQEAKSALDALTRLESRLRQLEESMGTAADEHLEEIMSEYATLRDRFEVMGGHSVERDVARVLRSLGFSEADYTKQASELSGGQKTRLAIARMVLSGTEVLLLDEPTNHLDIEATEWLESYLADFGGALVVVSHDRRFLDNVVTSVVELDNGALAHYSGSFSTYWTLRAEKLRLAEEDQRRRDEEIARLEEFWRRNKAGQNRNLAWSRLKAAERLRAREISVPSRMATVRGSLQSAHRSGNDVLIIENLSKMYGDRVLFGNFSARVGRLDRVGIVGPNGSGKSTFLRIVLGLEAPSSGSVRLGAQVVPSYFAQEGSDLDPSLTVLECLLEIEELPPAQARAFLAHWLFRGDAVFARVEQLSGGERNRLVLARLALLRPNLLVLDEPTNHLDIAAREALVEMLREYDGTLLVASHDRHLLDQVTTHTLVIAGGEAHLYEGSYSVFRKKRRPAMRSQVSKSQATSDKPLTSFELSRLRRQAVRDVAAAEKRVTEAEDWLKRIEECLSHPEPGDDMVRLAADYERAQKEVAEAMAAWEEAMTRAENLGALSSPAKE